MFSLLVVIIIFGGLLIWLKFAGSQNSKNFRKERLTYYHCGIDDKTNKLLKKILQTRGWKSSKTDFDFYIPCLNDFSLHNFINAYTRNKKRPCYMFYTPGCSQLGNKQWLWKCVLNHFGREKAENLMPKTYIFPYDLDIFKKRYHPNKMYILKSGKQKQKGLLVTNNYQEILDYPRAGYYLAQELIPSSLTYREHKLNFRLYLVIIVRYGKLECYLYPDGIISYTPDKSKDNSTFNGFVATFYQSTNLYNSGYPILISQLVKEMPHEWNNISKKMAIKLSKVMESVEEGILSYKLPQDIIACQLYGVDFLVDKGLEPHLLEMNFGPGMNPFGRIDKKMRTQMLNQMINLIFRNIPGQFSKIF